MVTERSFAGKQHFPFPLNHDILKGVYFDVLFLTNWNLATSYIKS